MAEQRHGAEGIVPRSAQHGTLELPADLGKDLLDPQDSRHGFHLDVDGQLLRPNRPEFRAILDASGLTCSSYITGYARFDKDLDGVIADAKALGAAYVLTAGIPRKGDLTLPVARKAAADFNRWGAQLRAAGLRFGYHPHGFEFVKEGDGTLFDVMLAETDPALVEFEMDPFWVAHGGGDPIRYLERFPRRFALVHLKDIAKGAPTGLTTGKSPDENSVVVGSGAIDFARLLAAAAKAGVKRYYIEDESPAVDLQVPLTLDYLQTVRFK
ncbi:MAG: sugar phosphate isomerase/epimerase [Bryobacteraceae bacterium]